MKQDPEDSLGKALIVQRRCCDPNKNLSFSFTSRCLYTLISQAVDSLDLPAASQPNTTFSKVFVVFSFLDEPLDFGKRKPDEVLDVF